MYSIASWSPSQSEPLIVSYMCHSQLSSDMLPSDAPMPPCAATVCERVGNTLDRTATFRPARASWSDARMPEPPAPTMTTSKRRRVMFLLLYAIAMKSSNPPERLDGPAGTAGEPDDDEHLQRQPHPDRLDVVHQDVAHADPHVPEQAHDDGEGEHLHPLGREDAGPLVVADRAAREQHLRQDDQGEQGHEHRGDALAEPVAHAVV